MSEPSLNNLRAELAADPTDISIAGRLIDLASTPADLPAAKEALSAIEAASSANAEDLGARYMLGTAQSSVARLHTRALSPSWAEQTSDLRLHSRANLFAATKSDQPEVSAMAWINLGHLLHNVARLSEAYDLSLIHI